MTRAVKLSITLPEDLVQEVRSRTDEDTSLSSVIRNLLQQALNDGCVDDSGNALQNDSALQRIESLEHGFNEFRDQIVQEVKDLKLSFLTEKVRAGPMQKPTGLRHGYIKLEGDVKQRVLERCEIMQAAGLSQEKIAPIMGLKGQSVVSQIRSGEKKSMTQKGYDDLMAWTP